MRGPARSARPGQAWAMFARAPGGQVKLNVYSGLMSSCQEGAHGLRSLLAEHDRGVQAHSERGREEDLCCPLKGPTSRLMLGRNWSLLY